MPLYASLILPLAVKETYHYLIDEKLCGDIPDKGSLIGSRALVSFGRKRFYTGIIDSISTDLPEGLAPERIKPISQILDKQALVPQATLDLWHWVADYYLCPIGQVMRLALPSGLLPESQSRIFLNTEYTADSPLSALEYKILDTLQASGQGGLRLETLQSRLGQSLSRPYTHLMALGAIYTEETVISRYRPKLHAHLRLTEAYRSEAGIARAYEMLRRAERQQEVLTDFLRQIKDSNTAWDASIPRLRLSRGESQRTALIKKLIDRGIWQVEYLPESRLQTPLNTTQASHAPLLEVSTLREDIQDLITQIPQTDPRVIYLDSPDIEVKTLTTIALIREHLERGEQVLLLSPCAYDTPNAKNYLDALEVISQGRLYYYHTQTNEAKRTETYTLLSQDPQPCIVIGTRQAVFLPLQRLGLILVDEEQEYMYKQQFTPPYYHARDVALYLGVKRGIKVILSSSSPSAETIFNTLRGKYACLQPSGANGSTSLGSYPMPPLPSIRCIDIRQERARKQMPYTACISPPLHEAIAQELQQGGRVLLLQNRRGYAPYVRCLHCHEGLTCPACDVSLTYHASERLLRCHYCNYNSPMPRACPHCGTQHLDETEPQTPCLSLIGYGVERVVEEVEQHFPEARVLRIDSDTLQSARARSEVHEQIKAGEVDIIVGTQLIKGQPLFDDLGLIGVIHLDAMLAYPDFRNYERSYQTLYQLMLRSAYSPRTKPCTLLIQTFEPEQPFIQRLSTHNYLDFIKTELSERQLTDFPPFTRLNIIRFKGFDEQRVVEIATCYAQHLRQSHPTLSVSDVQRPSIARIDGQYIREVICRRPYNEGYQQERLSMRWAEEQTAQKHPEAYKRVQIHYNIDAL